MTVFRNDNRWGRSNVEFGDGEIRSYDKETPTAAMRHIDYGVGCVRAAALSAFAPAGDPFDLASFYEAMLDQRQLAAYEVADRFYEIGSPAGLAETDALLRGNNNETGQSTLSDGRTPALVWLRYRRCFSRATRTSWLRVRTPVLPKSCCSTALT